jgi:hypothetical protein
VNSIAVGKNVDLVRYRNDGEDFHVLWTARRALRMLDPASGLVAVAVEGVSERERPRNRGVEAGLLVIDTAEYYGSEDLNEAQEVVYLQLKYSTTSPEAAWSVVGLRDTLRGFADRYTALCAELGLATVRDKIRFRFVSNRPISSSIERAMASAIKGTPLQSLDKRTKAARVALIQATGLRPSDFRRFASQVDLWGNEESRATQARTLDLEAARYTVFLNSDASKRMKDLIREKALSHSALDNTIDLSTLLQQFGLGSVRELLPAAPKFEPITNCIPRQQEHDITRRILGARWPVVIRAAGGVGKSVLAQRLPIHLPTGSEAVVYDGFAGGDYRNPRLHRHKHSRGLVHIANELARRGLCDVLLPQNNATEQQYLEAFRKRLEQAVAVVRSRAPDAIVLIVVDAADNLGMAAEDYQERSFAPDLLQEEPPEGCHVVALARTHRVEQYLHPADAVVIVDLNAFTLEESRQHLLIKFAEACEDDAGAFHRFTDQNPRVQANALAVADDLPSLIRSLGPSIETVEVLIAAQLETALEKVVREQAPSREEIKSLCAALAILPPPVPLHILAQAVAWQPDAVKSFVTDFASGRPIILRDDTVQFRDEPVETWFRDNFATTPEQSGKIADSLAGQGETDLYVAGVLPVILHRAGRYDQLMDLALRGTEPNSDDPVEKREVLLRRVQYALKAALARNQLGDATKLLLRTGEEVAVDNRQSSFLMEHADLVSDLAGSSVVSDFVFRHRPWRTWEKGYLYSALMLAADRKNRVEAEQFLSLAFSWLNQWFAHKSEETDNEPFFDREKLEIDDIAAYAEVIWSLRGHDRVTRFMDNWRPWAAFEATQKLISRALGRRSITEIEELLASAGERLEVRLGILLEMREVGVSPSSDKIRTTVELLVAEEGGIDRNDFTDRSVILLAIVATAELAARSGLDKTTILALLDRYSPANERVYHYFDEGKHRETFLRVAALRAALDGGRPTMDQVTPDSVKLAREQGRREDEREVREFRELYGALLPWYGLRALALLNRVDDWSELVSTVRKEHRSDEWGWGSRGPEFQSIVNEIGRVWFDALIWVGGGTDSGAAEVEKWLSNQRVMVTIPTWVSLTRRAAFQGSRCYAGALNFARRGKELLDDSHTDATEAAESLVGLARATLPLDTREAGAYFQLALEHLSKIGDEMHSRLFSTLALADKSGDGSGAKPQEAYRVARVGELFNAYNSHKFPWGDVIVGVTALCPATAFAVASRWNDRGQVSTATTLPSIARTLLAAGALRSTVATALHAFGGYWHLKESADLFLDYESNRAFKQEILDTVTRDLEFDPNSQESPVETLVAAAMRHGLDRAHLVNMVEFRRKLPDRSSPSWTLSDRRATAPAKPDWPELLRDIDLCTPEGVDEAQRRRPPGATTWEEFLEHLRRAVEPTRRADHVLALAGSEEFMVGMVLEALEAARVDWGRSVSVQAALRQAITLMTTQRSSWLISRGWRLDDTMKRCTALSGIASESLLKSVLQGLADQVEDVSSDELFNLAGSLARIALRSEEAIDALSFGLDRLEPLLKPTDGDGPWREELTPPAQLPKALAGFLYAMLASPEADLRWRATHAVRRLCRFGESQIITELVGLLHTETLPTFTDAALPFYSMHARLYLLIALARSAAETPESLLPHAREIAWWALEASPHVLIRHFASRAAQELGRHRPEVFEAATLDQLARVNVSPFPVEARNIGGRSVRHRDINRPSEDKYIFDYDFKRYWLESLAYAFRLSVDVVADRAERWIVQKWFVQSTSRRSDDPRASRGIYVGERYASHGSYPETDDHLFYLSYHAMFCAAGELLTEFPSLFEYGSDSWTEWMARHLLSREDGKWLADGRDFDPLQLRRWQLEDDDWKRRDEWQYSVQVEDLDQALGLADDAQQITVWAQWLTVAGQRKETTHVASAMVSPQTSLALLRALQTTDNSHDYAVPEERNDLEIRAPKFKLTGWISLPRHDLRLDRFDPFSGQIPWPGPVPGRRVRRKLGLIEHDDYRVWTLNAPVMERTIWGDYRQRRHGFESNHGQQLLADPEFLLETLRRLKRDMIFKVEIERSYGSEEKNPIEYGYRGYTRLYLLRRDGHLYTLNGCRRLRPATRSRASD